MVVLGGSGYYQYKPDCNEKAWASWGFRLGGSCGASFKNSFGGCGGTAGKGGNITIDNIGNVTALNGKFKQSETDTRTTDSSNECVIYAQLGFSLDKMNLDQIIYHTDVNGYSAYNNGDLEVARVSDTLAYANDAEGMITYLNYMNGFDGEEYSDDIDHGYRAINYDTYTTYGKLGIGSGAGFHEISNGMLTVENEISE